MDTVQTTPQPQSQPQPQDQNRFPQSPAPRSGNIGALAAAVVIVLILAAGGFYFFWDQQRKDAGTAQENTPTQTEPVPTAQADTTGDIESDLNATQTSGADADVSSLNDAL